MYSAFGVEHGDVVSKGGLGLIPKALGGGGVRMGSPMKAWKSASTGFGRAQKSGLNVRQSVGRGLAGAMKSSPGTMAATGAGVAATAGLGTGAALNRH